MASGNLPATAGNINPSSKTLGEIKSIVASIVGASSEPDEVEATSCIHRALDWIQNYTWESMLRVTAGTEMTPGSADYFLPIRFRKMHSVRVVSGTERALQYIRKSELDRLVQYQSTQGLPTHYTLYKKSDSAAVFTFWRTPDSAETFDIVYYKDFAKPTNDAVVIDPDFPSEWEHMLITYAQFLCGLTRGVRSERLEMLKREAEMALREAQMRDGNEFGEDLMITPDAGPAPLGAPFTGYDDASRWF